MGKLSRYDGGDLPDDRKRKKHKASASASRATVKKPQQSDPTKKPKSLTVRIRDVRRLMMKYTDEENQKQLQARLDELLKKKQFKEERITEWNELKQRIERSRRIRLIELKKLEKKLKNAEEDEVRELVSNDIEYVKSFPKGKEYLPLFSTTLTEKQVKERDDLRRKAALCRMEGKGGENNTMEDDADEDDFFAKPDDDEEEEEEENNDSDDD